MLRTAYTAINNILINAAIIISLLGYGRTNDQYLKSINWMSLKQHYEVAICKIVFKFLNESKDNPHYITQNITNGHSIRMYSENKLGIKLSIKCNDRWTISTFSYQAIDIYNRLPLYITLLSNKKLFKKWIKLFTITPNLIQRPRNIIYNDHIINYVNDATC